MDAQGEDTDVKAGEREQGEQVAHAHSLRCGRKGDMGEQCGWMLPLSPSPPAPSPPGGAGILCAKFLESTTYSTL